MNPVPVSAVTEWGYSSEDKLLNELSVLTACAKSLNAQYELPTIFGSLFNLEKHQKWNAKSKDISEQLLTVRRQLDRHREILKIVKYHRFVKKDTEIILPYWAYVKFCEFALDKQNLKN